MWWNIALWVISTAVAILLAPKPEVPKPATLDDFNVPIVKEGAILSLFGGTILKKDPYVAWYGDLKHRPIRASGGKK